MKPDWDKLAESFQGSATQLVADVDCTDSGEDLCALFGIEGLPTIMWGDPADLQMYEGGRSYDAIKAFADANLKPLCSPQNLELCDDAKRAEIQKFMDMSVEDLQAAIAEKEEAMEKIEDDLTAFVEKLNQELYDMQDSPIASDMESFKAGLLQKYNDKMEKVTEEKDAIKKSGLGVMRIVQAALMATQGVDIRDEL